MREGIHLWENWFYVITPTVGLHAVIILRYHFCAHIALIDKSPGLHWVLITLCPGLAWYRYLRCPLRSQLTSIERFQGFPGWRKGVHAVRISPLGIINPTRVLTEVSREQCHQCVTHPRGITQDPGTRVRQPPAPGSNRTPGIRVTDTAPPFDTPVHVTMLWPVHGSIARVWRVLLMLVMLESYRCTSVTLPGMDSSSDEDVCKNALWLRPNSQSVVIQPEPYPYVIKTNMEKYVLDQTMQGKPIYYWKGQPRWIIVIDWGL